MSIVQPWLPDAHVLDLYAGSGALGLEALSRGARSADLVERDPRVFRVLQQNVETLGAADAARLHRVDALRFAARLQALEYHVAFADPPYDSDAAVALASLWLEVPFSGVLGIEHSPRQEMPGEPAIRRYGSVAIAFYQAPSLLPDAP
jgi:16S rRNA (guanine966-N2)-methyltransferase